MTQVHWNLQFNVEKFLSHKPSLPGDGAARNRPVNFLEPGDVYDTD